LHGPGVDLGAIKEDAGGVIWSHPGPRAAGVYAVKRQGSTVFAVAVAGSAEESDLRPLDPSIIPTKAGAGRVVGYHSATGGDQSRDSAWAWAIVGCVLCLIAELAALKWFKT